MPLNTLFTAWCTIVLKGKSLKAVFKYLNVGFVEEYLLLFDSQKQNLDQWVKAIGMPIKSLIFNQSATISGTYYVSGIALETEW